MALSHLTSSIVIFFTTLLLLISPGAATAQASEPSHPIPWPEQFHALIFMNFTSTGTLYVTHNYYDWTNHRNINIMQRQLGDVLYNVEWGNGTSFYFTLGIPGFALPTCIVKQFPVGITTPDFLSSGSIYLGRRTTDGGFLCDIWKKQEFIWYYEDVATRRPVRMDFFDGISDHVITFEVGVVLEDSKWQAPAHCFNGEQEVVISSKDEEEGKGSFDLLVRRLHWNL